MKNMKKFISTAFVAFLVTALLAQIPKGTYVPCSDIAKNMNIEKVVFNANKATIYLGAMGITMSFEEFDYEVQDMNKKLPIVQVYFEYDKTNDILIFGEAYANSMLGNMLSQMGNGVKLMYNKNGNCNPNLIGNNKVRILVKDKNQDVTTEILNNYLILPDKNNIIPRLDKEQAIKNGKYTNAQIAVAIEVLRNELNKKFGEILTQINIAKNISSTIGNNSADFVNTFDSLLSIFTLLTNPLAFAKDWIIDDVRERMGYPSIGKFLEPNVSKDIQQLTTVLELSGKFIEALIAENNKINK